MNATGEGEQVYCCAGAQPKMRMPARTPARATLTECILLVREARELIQDFKTIIILTSPFYWSLLAWGQRSV